MKRIITTLIISFFLINLLLTGTLIWRAGTLTGQASDSHVFLCVTEPPTINSENCPTIMNQSTRIIDNRITCEMNATDPDNDTITYEVITPAGLNAQVNNQGQITLNASQQAVGNQTITLRARDSSGCLNGIAEKEKNITIIDINDPPEYYLTLPKTQFASGTTTSPYNLYDFFRDPDNDPLNYTVIGTVLITVTIQPNGDVIYTSNKCGKDYLIFRATDPEGLFDESGIVEVESLCTTPATSGTGGSGGGGGGGGGSFYSCESNWECKPWSECYINGTQEKECIDLNGCENDYIKIFWRNCTYIPTCYDGIMNGDETGVDCGGSCEPCGTCYDGIQNNDEEGIDCGGTYCEPCHNCSDGIQNWGEEGIDCGGPYCEPCPTCNDGIMNGDETGVDCGGSCEPCGILETPGIITKKNILTTSALILLIILLSLIIAWKWYAPTIKKTIAKLGWYFTRKKKKQILLTDEDKKTILKEIRELKKKLGKEEQETIIEELTRSYREYLSKALKIMFAHTREELETRIKKTINHESLRKVLMSYWDEMRGYETKKQQITPEALEALIQEYEQIIFTTSNITEEDLDETIQEKEPTGNQKQKIYKEFYNLYLALSFEEIEAAKKHYYEILKTYETLKEKEKDEIYDNINRAYHAIKYVHAWKR